MELTSTNRRRRSLGAALCAIAIPLAGGPLAAAANTTSTPAKDTFTGRITRATGAFGPDSGRVTILLHVAQSTNAARRLALTLVGAACPTAKHHCLRLSGILSGTISARPATIPDVGRSYDVSAGGRLEPIGHVSASGRVAGVGFIRQGREGLTITLRSSRGGLTITAASPEVPGFTSP